MYVYDMGFCFVVIVWVKPRAPEFFPRLLFINDASLQGYFDYFSPVGPRMAFHILIPPILPYTYTGVNKLGSIAFCSFVYGHISFI